MEDKLQKLKEIREMARMDQAMWVNDQIEVGEFTYGRPIVCQWEKKTKLKIGKFCSIGGGVHILLGGEHHTEWCTTYPLDVLMDEGETKSKGNVTIGNDVWIGDFVTILSGVTIGDGAVIGAGAVVAKDVNPYAVYGGVPAKQIRWRFKMSQIGRLQNLRWWDWPIEKIAEAYPFLMAGDVDRLVHFSGGWDDYE